MILIKWQCLPDKMQSKEVLRYYNILAKKKKSLIIKRAFDIILSFIGIVVFLPLYTLVAIAIKVDSPGPVFYRQLRVTQYGKQFNIFKFRTMVNNADKIGSSVTIKDDDRITRVGRLLRKYRIDETAQLLDVFRGTMTFVGTRPEAVKYVKHYTPEMLATLLLPAGVTSLASINYKDEAKLLSGAENPDSVYISKILPQKMEYNLKSIEEFSIKQDLITIFKTIAAILRQE